MQKYEFLILPTLSVIDPEILDNGFAKIIYHSDFAYVDAHYISKTKGGKTAYSTPKSTQKKQTAKPQKTTTSSKVTPNSTPNQVAKKPTVTSKPSSTPAKPKTAADYYKEGRKLATQLKKTEAIKTLQKAVDMGSVDAQYYLGMMLVNGGNDKQGFALILKAAEAGHKEAIFQVAELYNAGTGTPKNKTEAKVWYQKAEALGDGRAPSRLRKL